MSDDKQLERIEDKLDSVSERLNNIDRTLAGQHVSLIDHIRRTELLETQVIPIAKHVVMVSGVAKALGILSLLLLIASKLKEFL